MAIRLRTFVASAALTLLCGGAAGAAPQPAARSAAADLPALGEDLPPDAAPATPAAPGLPAKLFSIDTPVGKLCRHPEAKQVVDRDLPGLTTRPEYIFFRHMSLRQLQAASRGQMPMADLDKVSLDLDALGRPAPAPFLSASAALP